MSDTERIDTYQKGLLVKVAVGEKLHLQMSLNFPTSR